MEILFLIYLTLFTFSYGSDTELQLWEKFKLKQAKSYNSTEEDQLRFKIFKDNLKEINDHNEQYKKGFTTYEMELNKFADLTVNEYRTEYKMFPLKTRIFNDTLPAANEIEHGDSNKSDYLDWREKGAVTPVKNQGKCGACWIFSAIGALEGFYFRKYNTLIAFSEQHIIDCISNHSCLGGWPPLVVAHVLSHGAIREEDYRYEHKQGECRYNQFKNIDISIEDIVQVQNDDLKLKEAVTNFGPLIVCIYSSSKWRFYKRGVWYEKECSENSNHAMLLVGYGRENGVDFWLVKNSMGKDWGEDGYIKIARNKHHNYCGISGTAFYII